jgi:hypothetical protein
MPKQYRQAIARIVEDSLDSHLYNLVGVITHYITSNLPAVILLGVKGD